MEMPDIREECKNGVAFETAKEAFFNGDGAEFADSLTPWCDLV